MDANEKPGKGFADEVVAASKSDNFRTVSSTLDPTCRASNSLVSDSGGKSGECNNNIEVDDKEEACRDSCSQGDNNFKASDCDSRDLIETKSSKSGVVEKDQSLTTSAFTEAVGEKSDSIYQDANEVVDAGKITTTMDDFPVSNKEPTDDSDILSDSKYASEDPKSLVPGTSTTAPELTPVPPVEKDSSEGDKIVESHDNCNLNESSGKSEGTTNAADSGIVKDKVENVPVDERENAPVCTVEPYFYTSAMASSAISVPVKEGVADELNSVSPAAVSVPSGNDDLGSDLLDSSKASSPQATEQDISDSQLPKGRLFSFHHHVVDSMF